MEHNAAPPPEQSVDMVTGGYLVLVDISGSTGFLAGNELVHAAKAICQLLRATLNANATTLQASKLEGDAIFLYGTEALGLSLNDLLAQVSAFQTAFCRERDYLERTLDCPCRACRSVGSLVIKVVVHIGDFLMEPIGPFCELVGLDVVVAHRLLKNHLSEHEYLLITKSALDALGPGDGTPVLTAATEYYPDVGTVEFSYCLLSALEDPAKPGN